MDAYNQGYGRGIEHDKKQIGLARVVKQSDTKPDSEAVSVDFYAIAYDTPYGTVISYRGTDNPDWFKANDDIRQGYPLAAGIPVPFTINGSLWNAQPEMAAEFYQAVTGTQDGDPRHHGYEMTPAAFSPRRFFMRSFRGSRKWRMLSMKP
jgi:hypothetical protein